MSLLWTGPALFACTDGGEAPAPRTHVVEIREMRFHPAELRVAPGDTIEWINQDVVPHTATAPDSAWTSPPLGQGERWRRVARAPGTGSYICAYHPVMEARLIIEAPSDHEESLP